MTAKGLTWTAAHLRLATSPTEVKTAVGEAATQLGDGSVPAATVALLEEMALDSVRVRSDLRTATRVREVLLASVAHDLRNPLNTFAMSAGLLRDDLEGPDFDRTRALSLLSRMDRASARMQVLIEDLLEASKVEAGAIEFTRRPEHASVIARDAIEKSRPTVSDKGAKIEEGPIASDAKIDVDRMRTIDALSKLVVVAMKTTGEGGVIRLGVERRDATVVFSLRTTPPRGGSTAAPPDDGRGGLALLIARGLIGAQGGQIGSETSPDGPRTIVSFPFHA